jgi:hypothetical protein
MSSMLEIKLNARLQPKHRHSRYEDPLAAVLDERQPGSEISGGGTLMSPVGEPEWCDISVDLAGDCHAGRALVIEALESRGAPRGSVARLDGAEAVDFGVTDGLGLYLNGTDLPAEVYATSDINELINQLGQSLGEEGEMQSYWEGPRETALYLYGPSGARVGELIADVLASHPLAARSRLVTIT